MQDIDHLFSWFESRPLWQRDAARRLLEKATLPEQDMEELKALCLGENNVADGSPQPQQAILVTKEALLPSETSSSVKLHSIADVVGINSLRPRKPLEFPDKPVAVFFGGNGSGKSGYMRILNRACGVPEARFLHSDVFGDPPSAQGCSITYSVDNQAPKTVPWSPPIGPIADLRTVGLYDSDRANIYITKENEVTIEPPLISLLRRLAETADKVRDRIKLMIAGLPSRKPIMVEFVGSPTANWYQRLSAATSIQDIDHQCRWIAEDETTLVELTTRITQEDPASKATQLRRKAENIKRLTKTLQDLHGGFSEVVVDSLYLARTTSQSHRKAAQDAADKVFKGAPLTGVGSESWRLMWEQARRFSEEHAYRGLPFPQAGPDASCVLCQQTLAEGAKSRLQDFESFVKGALEENASKAEREVTRIASELVSIPSFEGLAHQLELAGIADPETVTWTTAFVQKVADRKTDVLNNVDRGAVSKLPDLAVVSKLQEATTVVEKQAAQFEQDAQALKRDELVKQVDELKARKWCHLHRVEIGAEVERLGRVKALEQAVRSCDTSAISSMSTQLSEHLITEAYVDRFKNELRSLGASRLQIEPRRSRTSKGVVFHELRIKNAKGNVPSREVWSEGELRIISIAAFLADLEARSGATPFVFDDPISSLDQDYEELVAERLVQLAKTRQVIVLTHRLALVYELEERSERALGKGTIAINALVRQPWGAGDPSGPPLPAQKTDKALNTLLGERLAAARKRLEMEGYEGYYIEAKALCSDIRITIERLIENDLLSDVVQRFRRPIKTQGKIPYLQVIRPEDCKLMDEMMSRYSRYEHSQPLEAQIPLPEPDEIKADLEQMVKWLSEFKNLKAAIPV